MIFGINLDPTLYDESDWKGIISNLTALHVDVVRLVLQPLYGDKINSFIALLKSASIKTVGVVAYESGFLGPFNWQRQPSQDDCLKVFGALAAVFGWGVDYWQIGNEPDVVSDASWTMPSDEINLLLQNARTTFPQGKIIGPGLGSGNLYSYATGLVDIVAFHRYQPASDYTGSTPAGFKLDGKPIWITEYPSNEKGLGAKICKVGHVDAAILYCYSQLMSPEYGILDGNNNPVQVGYNEFKELSQMTVTVKDINVGAGAQSAITKNSDYALRDSDFMTNADGTQYELAYGAKGNYHCSNASGNWKVYFVPFQSVVELL